MGRGKRLTGAMDSQTEIFNPRGGPADPVQMARKGSVTAASVLERVLRAQAEETSVEDELDRIVRRD